MLPSRPSQQAVPSFFPLLTHLLNPSAAELSCLLRLQGTVQCEACGCSRWSRTAQGSSLCSATQLPRVFKETAHRFCMRMIRMPGWCVRDEVYLRLHTEAWTDHSWHPITVNQDPFCFYYAMCEPRHEAGEITYPDSQTPAGSLILSGNSVSPPQTPALLPSHDNVPSAPTPNPSPRLTTFLLLQGAQKPSDKQCSSDRHPT